MEKALSKEESQSISRPLRFAGYLLKNEVVLVKGGENYFTLLEKLIDEAKESIYLQTYIFEADETGKRIARALLKAAQRNVKISILLDGYASQHLPLWLIETFLKWKIEFEWFQPLLRAKFFYVGRRLHHKVVVVDSMHVLVGGLNISDRYNDTVLTRAWLDWAIYAKGEIGRHIKRICQRRSKINWNIPPVINSEKAAMTIHECKVRPRINDWVNRKMQIWNSYMEMFRKAESHIIIMSPYFMPGHKIRKKMSEAVRRGVSVKIILGSKSDVALARYAEKYLYPWLLRNKVEIYEYQENILHGKLATYDSKWVTIGSYNMNNLSAYASVELNLDVDNKEFAHTVESELEKIITMHCKRITAEHFKKEVSLLQLFLQRSAYDIIRALLFMFTFYFRQRD